MEEISESARGWRAPSAHPSAFSSLRRQATLSGMHAKMLWKVAKSAIAGGAGLQRGGDSDDEDQTPLFCMGSHGRTLSPR
eukprot:scaffold3382_cov108-Isochrysis_galbana.AAC.8